MCTVYVSMFTSVQHKCNLRFYTDFSVERHYDLSVYLIQLPQNVIPKSLTQSPKNRYQFSREMPHSFYVLLTSMLSLRDHTVFQAFKLQILFSWPQVFCKGLFIQSHLKLYSASGIEINITFKPGMGMIVALGTFTQIVPCFKYAGNKYPGIRLFKFDPDGLN